MICLLQIYNSFHENFQPLLGSEHVGARRDVCFHSLPLSVPVCACACVGVCVHVCCIVYIHYSQRFCLCVIKLVRSYMHGHKCVFMRVRWLVLIWATELAGPMCKFSCAWTYSICVYVCVWVSNRASVTSPPCLTVFLSAPLRREQEKDK